MILLLVFSLSTFRKIIVHSFSKVLIFKDPLLTIFYLLSFFFVKTFLKLYVVFLLEFYIELFLLKSQGDLFLFYPHLFVVLKTVFNILFYIFLLCFMFVFLLSTTVNFYPILLIRLI